MLPPRQLNPQMQFNTEKHNKLLSSQASTIDTADPLPQVCSCSNLLLALLSALMPHNSMEQTFPNNDKVKIHDSNIIDSISAATPQQVDLAAIHSKILNLPPLDWLLAWVQALPKQPHQQTTSTPGIKEPRYTHRWSQARPFSPRLASPLTLMPLITTSWHDSKRSNPILASWSLPWCAIALLAAVAGCCGCCCHCLLWSPQSLLRLWSLIVAVVALLWSLLCCGLLAAVIACCGNQCAPYDQTWVDHLPSSTNFQMDKTLSFAEDLSGMLIAETTMAMPQSPTATK